MRKSPTKRWLIPALLVAAVMASAGQTAVAQRKPATPAKRKARKPRGRLPAYFARVVTGEQRKEIYTIQAKYNTEIEKLRKQLMQLIKDRDQEVTEVLTPEQLQKVKTLKAAAREKRRKRRASRGAGTTRRRRTSGSP